MYRVPEGFPYVSQSFEHQATLCLRDMYRECERRLMDDLLYLLTDRGRVEGDGALCVTWVPAPDARDAVDSHLGFGVHLPEFRGRSLPLWGRAAR